jgi:hypothetical protein
MASKKSGSKAKSGGGARARKGKATMTSLKDLEAKGTQKIKGGDIWIGKVVDKSTPVLR